MKADSVAKQQRAERFGIAEKDKNGKPGKLSMEVGVCCQCDGNILRYFKKRMTNC